MRCPMLVTASMVGAVFTLLAVSASAASYTPWPGHDSAPIVLSNPVELAQGKDSCCKHCTKGQPCGNTCISAKAVCKSPPGCAC